MVMNSDIKIGNYIIEYNKKYYFNGNICILRTVFICTDDNTYLYIANKDLVNSTIIIKLGN